MIARNHRGDGDAVRSRGTTHRASLQPKQVKYKIEDYLNKAVVLFACHLWQSARPPHLDDSGRCAVRSSAGSDRAGIAIHRELHRVNSIHGLLVKMYTHREGRHPIGYVCKA